MKYPRVLVIAAIGLCAALWTYACGDGTTDPPPPDPPRATTVTVTPATTELTALGETVRFTAPVLDQNGQAMAGAPVAWSSSDASVATVDASGLATTAGDGTATITATSGSASGTAVVTVMQAVSAVAVSPAADTLVALGDTVRLTAVASDANGHAVAGAEFTWATSDTSIASVDASGLVTAEGTGTATITATASGASGVATVTVAIPNVDAVFDSLMLAFTRERDIGAGPVGEPQVLKAPATAVLPAPRDVVPERPRIQQRRKQVEQDGSDGHAHDLRSLAPG